MNFHTITHSRLLSTSSDASMEDLLENVLNDIQEHEEKHQTKLFENPYEKHTKPTLIITRVSSIDDTTRDPTPSLPLSTTDLAVEAKMAFNSYANTNKQRKYKLFSPNPFYPGQSISVQIQPPSHPMLSSAHSETSYFSNNNTSSPPPRPPSLHSIHSTQSMPNSYRAPPLQTITEEPILKLENALRERDEDNDGALDLEEFTEALHEIDSRVDHNDLKHIFEILIDENGNSSADLNELSIDTFMRYIRNAYSRRSGSLDSNATVHMNMISVVSPTPMTVFRGAFPDIFGDIHDIENREVWGDEQTSPMQKLETELQEEAGNEGVIDFPEFEAAINSIGINLNKQQLKKLFAHFLGEQDCDNNMSSMHKKYEVQLAFLMDYLKRKVENHQHLQPKQILQLAFMDLLLNENLLNKRSSFLETDDDDDCKLHEIDDDTDDGDDSCQEFARHAYEVSDNPNSSGFLSITKGDRQLMRQSSSFHWTEMEVEQQKEEMENQLKLMQQQSSGNLANINGNASFVPYK